MNKVLDEQLKSAFGDPSNIPKGLENFLKSVSDTYNLAEEAKNKVEQSLKMSSKELSEHASLLKATLEATADGILIVDDKGNIVSYNQQFIDMWRIPQEIIVTRDDNKAIAFVLEQLKDPEVFTKKVYELYSQPTLSSQDLLDFKDGRIFERFSQPQYIGDKIVGRVWNFRDITEKQKLEKEISNSLAETKRLNEFMIDRELKMAELKKEIDELKSNQK